MPATTTAIPATTTAKAAKTIKVTKATATSRTAKKPQTAFRPLPKKPLPAGWPRERYESYNRRLKAMRLAIALLDAGVYTPERARNRTIRNTAARIGVHRPSNITCRMVRDLILETH
ncbi:hypothetical protein [Streptomyces sp. NPDC003077]|uniref:hypothetical protein n=1 Tax=Streptomyces sp. NPDC003077 TaxID=3154443 RepID=UPI0033B61177